MKRKLLTLAAVAVVVVACSKRDQVKEDVQIPPVGDPPQSTSASPTTSPKTPKAPAPRAACPVAPPVDGKLPPRAVGSMPSPQCKKDSDCTAGIEGRCVFTGGGHAADQLVCTYDGCKVDGDCTGGQLCVCGAGGSSRNFCTPGDCHDGADCASGSCAASMWGKGGAFGRYCHTSRDTCKENSDCKTGEVCAYLGAGSRFECMPELPRPVG